MPSPTSIPPQLAPLVQSPTPGSLTLITSVLESPPNWLILRYIHAALRPERHGRADENQHKHGEGAGETADKGTSGDVDETRNGRRGEAEEKGKPEGEHIPQKSGSDVILISFLQPYGMWREMGKKMGLDLTTYLSNTTSSTTHADIPSSSAVPRLIFVDALTGLSLPFSTKEVNHARQTSVSTQHINSNIHTVPAKAGKSLNDLGDYLASLIRDVTATNIKRSCLVILDSPDVLCFSLDPVTFPTVNPLTSLLTTLCSSAPFADNFAGTLTTTTTAKFFSTLISCSADFPLLFHPPNQSSSIHLAFHSPQVVHHRQFLLSIAHQARHVLQLRGLTTGVAKDVSGVIRISHGGGWSGDEDPYDNVGDGDGENDVEEGDYLYSLPKAGGGPVMWNRRE